MLKIKKNKKKQQSSNINIVDRAFYLSSDNNSTVIVRLV